VKDIESQIICEGYHDRAFWSGMLKQLGCTDPGDRGNGRRFPVPDAFGDEIRGGNYGFLSKSGAHIKIVPARSKDAIPEAVRSRLRSRTTKKLDRLIVNVDSDRQADGSPPSTRELTPDKILHIVQQFDPAVIANGDELVIDGGDTKVSLVSWKCNDPASDGLPHQHTLERVVCAAIAAAFPSRGPAVHNWLHSRLDPPPPDPKEHAFSYLAGWYARVGSYEGFFSTIWGIHPIVAELVPRLDSCGAWGVANLLAI
jgi:hypothetical protein